MRENENLPTGDVSDLFKQRVLSGEKYGSIYFWEDLHKLEKEGAAVESIRIDATDLPVGRERVICNFLKAFLEKDLGRISKQVVITGTKEQYDHLITSGCSNALASGVKFEKVD